MTFHRAADAKGMTLTEFLDRHTSTELTEIIVRDRLDPYDIAGRFEIAIGKLCALVFNANRDRNKGEALSAADFIPSWGRQYRDQAEAEALPVIMTPAELRATMQAMRTTAALRKGR